MTPDGRWWRIAAVVLGTITAGTQVVLLREAISIFLGNELVIGILMFDWLALTGLGALVAGWHTKRRAPSGMIVLVFGILLVFPPLTLVAFQVLPLLVAPAGSMLEIDLFLVGTILVLSPVCMASGAAFSLLVRASAGDAGGVTAGKVYAWEGLGSLIGGVMFGILLFDLVSSQTLLLVLSASAGCIGAVAALATTSRSVAMGLLAGVLVLVVMQCADGIEEWKFGSDIRSTRSSYGWKRRSGCSPQPASANR